MEEESKLVPLEWANLKPEDKEWIAGLEKFIRNVIKDELSNYKIKQKNVTNSSGPK